MARCISFISCKLSLKFNVSHSVIQYHPCVNFVIHNHMLMNSEYQQSPENAIQFWGTEALISCYQCSGV